MFVEGGMGKDFGKYDMLGSYLSIYEVGIYNLLGIVGFIVGVCWVK